MFMESSFSEPQLTNGNADSEQQGNMNGISGKKVKSALAVKDFKDLKDLKGEEVDDEMENEDFEDGKRPVVSSKKSYKFMSMFNFIRDNYRREESPIGHGDVKKHPTLLKKCLAEAFGTFMIVFTGVGVVNAAVFSGAQSGIWQVAVVWGFGVTLAIYTTATVSGAHLNPAVSLAFALLRPNDFKKDLLIPYWISQFLGGFIGGFVNYLFFRPIILAFEDKYGIVRGEPESILSAMAFGEYFPNPGFHFDSSFNPIPNDGSGNFTQFVLKSSSLYWDNNTITPGHSFLLEAFGTGILMLVILSLTDDRNTALTNKDFAPFFIGFTVSVLISLFACMNQAGFNPARDFGPRLASAALGWKSVAIPGPKNGFWTYIIGPLVGAPLGGAFYDYVLRPPKN